MRIEYLIEINLPEKLPKGQFPMRLSKWYACLISLCFILPGCASVPDKAEAAATPSPAPEAIETGMLEAKPGFVGDVLGAEVTEMDTTGDTMDVISVTVPVEPGQIEVVRVIAPSGNIVEQEKPAELSPDYQNHRVGVRLYLPKRKNWEFKLRLVDPNADR